MPSARLKAANAAGADGLSKGKKNPKRARGTKCALGAQAGGAILHRRIGVTPRRSGRAAVDSLGGGLGRPNPALAAAEGPQVRKAAASRCGAGEMHRASAVRARRPDDGVVADRPLQFLERQHGTSSRCISNERMKFKRTFETRAGRKQGIFVIFPTRLRGRTPQGRPRRNSIIAALTSPARSCWVQWPQPGSMIVPRRSGTNLGRPGRSLSTARKVTTISRSPAT